jgi:hypothetical protein
VDEERLRDLQNQIFRFGAKPLTRMGGRQAGEPCITEVAGGDPRHRPPALELTVAFPNGPDIHALGSPEHFVTEQTVRVLLDHDWERPSEGTVLTVQTEYGAFLGTVTHDGDGWRIDWDGAFHTAVQEAAAAPKQLYA